MDKAPRFNSTVASLLVAALAAGSIALAVDHWRTAQQVGRKAIQSAVAHQAPAAQAATPASEVTTASTTQVRAPAAVKQGAWSASAPGRVEPRDGEVRIGAQMSAKVVQVLVRMNDQVKAGDLLVRLADEEAMAKLAGAQAEAAVRRRERDTEPAVKLAADRRVAEDALSTAERTAFRARMELDRLQMAGAGGNSNAKDIEPARAALTEANEKVETERVNLRRVQAQAGMPLPTRLEASLAVARSELAALESAIDRTRVRAPYDGTVLLVNTRIGETASPSPEDILLWFGDMSMIRVRAEIEERDVGKIRKGQAVIVRTDAFPGQDFNGRVELMANALGSPRIASKGARRPNEQDVLQVLVDLEGRPPLIPGMRVDLFFKPDATVNGAQNSNSRSN